jgi:hypothetical protein
MDASRPLLGGDRDDHADGERTPRGFECLPRWRTSPSAESHTSSSSSNASTGERRQTRKSAKRLADRHGSYQRGALFPGDKGGEDSQYVYIHDGDDSAYDRADSEDGDSEGRAAWCCLSARRRRAACADWPCWKWLMPERIADYDDFASTAQVCSI